MSKVKFFILAFLSLTIFSFFKVQKDVLINQCEIENFSFEVGEYLVYRAYYNWGPIWIPAGEVSFKVEDADSLYHIKIVGKTYTSYESIYKVYDRYESYVDKETLQPHTFIRDIQEGSYYRYDSLLFDLKNEKIKSYWSSKKDSIDEFDFEMKDCMHDLISVLYFVRNINYDSLKKGDMIPLDIFFDKELYPIKMEYGGKKKKKKIKGLGKRDVLKIIPEAIDGHVFSENTKMTIWASDDGRRVPLLVESPVIIGKVKGVLIKDESIE